jgi:hypothetical protein
MTMRTSLLLLLPLIAACSAHARSTPPSEGVTRPAQAQFAAPDAELYFLDGEEIQRADFLLIDRASIASLSYLTGPTATARYGPRAGAVIEIVTSKDRPAGIAGVRQASRIPLVLLDGREVPAALVGVLDTSKIEKVEVIKGAPARLYGDRAHDGVVLITSKSRAD